MIKIILSEKLDYDIMVGDSFSSVKKYGIVSNKYNEALVFKARDNKDYMETGLIMFHGNECCEEVILEDICGNLEDLENAIFLKSEETINRKTGANLKRMEWTFYNFTTTKGCVTLRWYGTSNGCYSTSVNLYRYHRVSDSCRAVRENGSTENEYDLKLSLVEKQP